MRRRTRLLSHERRGVVAFNAAGTVVTVALLWFAAPTGDWSPTSLVIVLFLLAPATELWADRRPDEDAFRLSPSDVIVTPAMVLLGPVPAAITWLLPTVIDIVMFESPYYSRSGRVAQLWIHALFPALGSLTFFALSRVGTDPSSASFLAATAGAASIGLLVNHGLLLAETWLTPGGRGQARADARLALQGLVSVMLPTLALSVTVVAVYGVGGLYSLLSILAGLFAFRWLHERLVLLRTQERELQVRNEQLAAFPLGVLALLTDTLAQRDRQTARHSAAVARWSRDLAKEAGCDDALLWTVHTGALLHDLGKFVLPDSVLYHEGTPTPEHRAHLRRHPDLGADLVSRLCWLSPVADAIRHHHERFDGTGYPGGLTSTEIPIAARIIAICETYDVLTARDSSRLPVSSNAALDRLRAGAGIRFDPSLVEGFTRILERSPAWYGYGDDADFQVEVERALADERSRLVLPPARLWAPAIPSTGRA